MTINEIQDQIIEEFSLFPEWAEKYEYILDLGKQLPLIDEACKTEEYLVPGCQSPSWLHVEMIEDKVILTADCDAQIGRGIIALLIRVLSGYTAEEIIHADLYFLDEIGLQENLSMNRASGLENIISKIKSDVAIIQTG